MRGTGGTGGNGVPERPQRTRCGRSGIAIVEYGKAWRADYRVDVDYAASGDWPSIGRSYPSIAVLCRDEVCHACFGLPFVWHGDVEVMWRMIIEADRRYPVARPALMPERSIRSDTDERIAVTGSFRPYATGRGRLTRLIHRSLFADCSPSDSVSFWAEFV
jgi:hypothetical protein